MSKNETINVTLTESRKFSPAREFAAQANVNGDNYGRLLELGMSDPEAYWAEAAAELEWKEPWKKVLDWKAPFSQWFVGGKLNATASCLDRHAKSQPQKTAILWEGEPGEVVSVSYGELFTQTQMMTAQLRRLGLKSGDRVAIYMPLVPESVVAMLACARAGLTHTVVFGGFSSQSLQDRIQDCQARAVITADFGYRKGGKVDLRTQVDTALATCPTVEHVISLKRDQVGKTFPYAVTGTEEVKATERVGNAKVWDWSALMASTTRADVQKRGGAEIVDAEHPLFILYTSGTTGKPKGLVHSTGGYMTGVMRTSKMVFDLKPTDLYWCTADIGWITGHSYVVYGPLACGSSIFLYEGAPMTPKPDRFWSMIERHKISILYTAPTAIRAFMKLGTDQPKAHDLSSLRLLGSVGEPINPEAWIWYRDHIGGGTCPVVDTFWQTETGAIVVSPLPGVVSTKPGSATFALPGYAVDVVDKMGNSVPLGSGGFLVIKKPWPSMARTIHGDPDRYRSAYFGDFKDNASGEPIYFTGDGARKDEEGYIWCLGRVDDVLNVSGHRLGTMEIESALVAHKRVAEAAVVGRPDEMKGQGIVAFVTLKTASTKPTGADLEVFKNELKKHVADSIGALARPDEIRFTEALPKTRSGKIMRRLLRELASSGHVKGDTTTLEDLSVIAALQSSDED